MATRRAGCIFCAPQREVGLFVVLQTDFQLMMSLVQCPDGIDAVPAKIMSGVVQVIFCIFNGPHRRTDFGVPSALRRRSWGQASNKLNTANKPINLVFFMNSS
jgi:hypothetical protein